MSKVAIIGGGITGLAAAWELQQQGVDYILLEGSQRLGGKILTEHVDGFIIEAAADSFLTQKPAAWQLCHELGLSDRLIGTNDVQRNVYVLRNGKLHLFPRGMRLIVPLDPDGLLESDLLSDEGKRRMLAEPDVPPRTDTGDESLASFVERRFGKEALTVFGDSLLAGIHVANPQQLSMAAAFPNYLELEQKYGSVIRGMKITHPAPAAPNAPKTAFASLRSGMMELIEGLQAKLTGDIRIGQQVVGIEPDRIVRLANSDSFKPDAVLLATPPSHSAKLIQWHEALSTELAAFRTVNSGTVSLGFRAEEMEHPLDGFGFVIPHSESTRILACTWNSTKLPYRAPEGYILLRVFIGGYGREKDVELNDEDLVALARDELHNIMGIRSKPVISRVFRWRGTDPFLNASPQYEVGHLDRIAHLRECCPSWLHLAGCAYEGVGIPDCVQQGRAAAQTAIRSV